MKDATDITLATNGLASEPLPRNQFLQSEALPKGDYVSEGLSVAILDRLFPSMIVGNKADYPWPYLRREVPHNWYCDRRYPRMGFLDRDEAMLRYNLVLQLVSSLPATEKLTLMDRAVSRWSGEERTAVECAKAVPLWELGESGANEHLDLVEQSFETFPRPTAAIKSIRTRCLSNFSRAGSV